MKLVKLLRFIYLLLLDRIANQGSPESFGTFSFSLTQPLTATSRRLLDLSSFFPEPLLRAAETPGRKSPFSPDGPRPSSVEGQYRPSNHMTCWA